MRLTQYINESNEIDPEEIDELIDKNCKSVLKELKGHILYRGIKKFKGPCYKIQTRADRNPTDTPKAVQKMFDDICQDLYGWMPRSTGVFCTGDRNQAGAYGSIYTIWPIGNFKFIWSEEIRDFYTTLKIEAREFRLKHKILHSDDIYSEIYKNEEFQLRIAKVIKESYTNINLYKATLSAHEIMISCKEYYVKEYK